MLICSSRKRWVSRRFSRLSNPSTSWLGTHDCRRSFLMIQKPHDHLILSFSMNRNGARGTLIRVIGKFRSEDINELKFQIEGGDSPTALDLEEASIVDVDAARFFNACEDNGIEILNRS